MAKRFDTTELEYAGIVGESGQLTRPVSERWEVFPSEIFLIRDPADSSLDRCDCGDRLKRLFHKERALLPAIVWNLFDGENELSIRENDGRVLEDFLRLTESSSEDLPDRVLRLSKEYGVLFPVLCQGYNESVSSAQLQRKLLSLGVPVTKNLRNLQFEPVEVWLHLACKARAILSAAAALHTKKPVSAQDWNTLNEGFSNKVPVSIKKAKYSYFFLTEILNRWLEIGEVSLRMSGFEPDRIEVVGAGVLGSIARQLLFSVARVDLLAFCNGCGTPFLPKRRPTQGRQSWCATCRKGKAPQRQAQRDYRARQLAKRHPDRLFKQKSGDV